VAVGEVSLWRIGAVRFRPVRGGLHQRRPGRQRRACNDFVRIIAGFKGCEKTAYSELEVGSKPGKPTFSRVTKQVNQVVKGLGKTCKMTAPALPKLEVAQLFPKAAG